MKREKNRKMKTKQQIQDEIKKLEEELKKLEQEDKCEIVYTPIKELGIEISQQVYNNKTYPEILELVKESQIADHNLLFKLRSMTNKYPQFKNFWVFCPNTDKLSKDNNFVAWFDASSDWADFGCYWNPASRSDSLGVFLWRKLK